MSRSQPRLMRLNRRQKNLLEVVASHLSNTMRSPIKVQRTASELERKGLIRWANGWEFTPLGFHHYLQIVKR